jgi:hypothetical protein
MTNLSSIMEYHFEALDISGNEIVDLSPLTGLKLKELKLYDCDLITDLSPLQKLPLEILDISGCDLITNITPLQTIPLKELHLPRKVESLSALRGMPLEHLDIADCKKLTDLSPLTDMPLKRLWMVYVPVEDISALATTQLVQLNANCTDICDLTPLQYLPLEFLLIRSTQVTDVSPLANLPLIRVEFDYNKATNGIDSLRTIESLESICSVSPDDFWDIRSPKVLDEAYFAELEIPSDTPFAMASQNAKDEINKILNQEEWPDCIKISLKFDRAMSDPEVLMENVVKYTEIAEFLGLNFDQVHLVNTWDSTESSVQISSNNTLEVDYNLLTRKTYALDDSALDPNDYLNVLTNLSLQKGYILDYVYWGSGGNGRPFLYARTNDAPRLESHELLEFLIVDNPIEQNAYLPCLDVLHCDGTENGFFQLALFEHLADQFYLAWHAAYNDIPLITSYADMHQFLANPKNFMREKNGKPTVLPEPTVLKALELDPTPIVKIDSETVSVKVLAFSNWRGFFQKTLTFEKQPPNLILSETEEILIPYRCPIMF